jgi:hypothetical protein
MATFAAIGRLMGDWKVPIESAMNGASERVWRS